MDFVSICTQVAEEEGVPYPDLFTLNYDRQLAQVRYKIADRALKETNLSVQDIERRFGYKPNAFRKSYNRYLDRKDR